MVASRAKAFTTAMADRLLKDMGYYNYRHKIRTCFSEQIRKIDEALLDNIVLKNLLSGD